MTRHFPHADGDSHQDRIRRRITVAVRTMRGEILANYEPKTGLYRYDKNGGRVSEAEVLRRAGRVDKNTLKQSYHRKSKATVRRLVNWARKKCSPVRAEPTFPKVTATSQTEISELRELLGAAEARQDIAELAVETAKRHELAAVEKALALESEVKRLRTLLVQQSRLPRSLDGSGSRAFAEDG